MINNDLVNYFKEGIENKHSSESLTESLLKAGWAKNDIDDSLLEVLNNKAKPLPTIHSISTSVNSVTKKERPTGVSILAVLIWINSGFLAIFAVLSLLFFSLISSIIPSLGNGIGDIWMFSVVIFLFFALFALFGFFYGRGLWRGQNGWRIFYLIIGGLSLLFGISSLFSSPGSGVFQLAITGFLIWYMGFKKNVVDFFKK